MVREGKPQSGSRVHLIPINELGTQLYPDGPDEYATDLPHRLPTPEKNQPGAGGRYAYHSAHAHRIPTHIRQIRVGST